jgi:hypothetical protein
MSAAWILELTNIHATPAEELCLMQVQSDK